MKSFLPALFLAVLIPAASASTIMGGAASFDRIGEDGYVGLYHFNFPFLYGSNSPNGNNGPGGGSFALFGMDTSGRCSLFDAFTCNMDAIPFSPQAALIKGKYVQGLTAEGYTALDFQPFDLDPLNLRVQVPLSWAVGWQLKSAQGKDLNFIYAFGNGLATLQLDSAFRVLSGSFNFSPVVDDLNGVDNPEPGTLLLFSTGVGLIAWAKRRKSKKATT